MLALWSTYLGDGDSYISFKGVVHTAHGYMVKIIEAWYHTRKIGHYSFIVVCPSWDLNCLCKPPSWLDNELDMPNRKTCTVLPAEKNRETWLHCWLSWIPGSLTELMVHVCQGATDRFWVMNVQWKWISLLYCIMFFESIFCLFYVQRSNQVVEHGDLIIIHAPSLVTSHNWCYTKTFANQWYKCGLENEDTV